MFKSTGPAAPLSHGHSTVACQRRHNAQSSPTSKPTANSHDVANATARATTQHGACLRTTTSGVHKHAKATEGSHDPSGRPKSAYASSISKCSPSTPSKAKARGHPRTRVCKPPETSRASTLLHDASRETRRPACQCQVQGQAAPSLPQKGGPLRVITSHQRPSSPGGHHRAESSVRSNTQLAKDRHNKPEVRANVGNRVTAISKADVTQCARQPSPRDAVIKSVVNRPEATLLRPHSSPTHAKRPAVDSEQGPCVPSQDSQTGNKRAEGPHNIGAQRTSRRKRPFRLLSQKDRAARSYDTPEISETISPTGGHDVNQPARYLSSASQSMSGPPGLSSSATTPRPSQQSAESGAAEPNTEVQNAKLTLRRKR